MIITNDPFFEREDPFLLLGWGVSERWPKRLVISNGIYYLCLANYGIIL